MTGVRSNPRLVDASRKTRRQRQRNRRILQATGLAALILIVTLAGIAVWRWQVADQQFRIALARQLAALAGIESGDRGLILGLEATRILDPQTGRPLTETNEALRSQLAHWAHWERNLISHTVPITATAVTFAGNDNSVLTAGENGRVTLWNVGQTDVTESSIFATEAKIGALAFDSTHNWLAIGTDSGEVRILAARENWREVASWPATEDSPQVTALALNSDLLVSGDTDFNTTVRPVANPATPTSILNGTEWIRAVALSPDGQWLAVGGEDKQVRVWNLQEPDDGNPTLVDPHTARVRAVAISHDGRWLAGAGEEGTVHIIDLQHSEQPPRILRDDSIAAGIWSMAFDPQSSKLIIGVGGQKGALVLTDVAQSPIDWQVLAHLDSPVESLAVSPSGHRIATVADDGNVRLWQTRPVNGEPELLEGHSNQVRGLTFSPLELWRQNTPSGRFLVSAAEDGTLASGRYPIAPS